LSRKDRQTEASYVPGLSCERGVHRGERDVNEWVDRARGEERFGEMAAKIINQTKLEETK
jgi:hypothetical protein